MGLEMSNKNTKVIIVFFFIAILCMECNSEPIEAFLFPFEYEDKWGYLNKNLKVIIEPQYFAASFFHEGFATVQLDERRWAIIEGNGDIVFEKDVHLLEYHEGLIGYRYKNDNGFFDINGNLVLKLNNVLSIISGFKEGLAIVRTKKGWTYINKNGNLEFNGKYYESCSIFKNGIARVLENGKYGYINKQGDYMLKPIFDYLDYFSEGLCLAEKGDERGFIDEDGEFVVKLDIYTATPFYDGVSLICTGGVPEPKTTDEKRGTWHLIDMNSNFIEKDMNIKNVSRFSEGLAVIDKGRMGYINTKGEIVIEPIFFEAWPFYEGYGLAFIFRMNNGLEKGIIDIKGNVTWVSDVMKSHMENQN